MSLVDGPGWSASGLEQRAGRYPLRVEAPVMRVAELLVPGVTSQTRYVRYYAFYAALAAHAAEHQLDADACRMLLRRGEAVLAGVSLVHDDPDGWPGMAHGADETKSSLGVGLPTARVADAEDADHRYSSRAWGFWEQYKGPSAVLGTVGDEGGALRPGRHACPAEVVELFAPLLRAAERDVLDGARLDALAPLAMQAPDRRETAWMRGLLTATRYGRHESREWERDDRRRRDTFRMLARALMLHGDEFDRGWEHCVRSAVAFGGEAETDPVLRDVDGVLGWRGLLLRNYSVSAWRRLWAGLVRSMGSDGGEADRTRDELCDWLMAAMPDESLRSVLDGLPDTMSGGHPAPAERHVLAGADRRDPVVNVKLLLVGGLRAKQLAGEARTTFLGARDILNPLWMRGVIDDFADRPMRDLAERLVDDMLAQSRRVALAKMRPDKDGRMKVFSRVHERGGRFYKTGDEGDSDIGTRIHQTSDLAHQLGLVRVTADGTAEVTPLGESLLEVTE
ncbi:hypothetical protein [Actinomadura rifamycini]|uniref:hypothetical protein n=1 Tax=Actinomadura rifamycini TaxID=31962 RepID=UPI0004152D1E|nr:hypothetical protein [Actinomadura rifamycini]